MSRGEVELLQGAWAVTFGDVVDAKNRFGDTEGTEEFAVLRQGAGAMIAKADLID